VVRTRSRDNIAGGVSDGGRLSRLYGDVEIAGPGADGRAHQRNRRRAGLTITAVIAGPQRPAAERLSRVRGANFSVRESCRYRGSGSAATRRVITAPRSEFQRRSQDC
jgi:hypothetical protein